MATLPTVKVIRKGETEPVIVNQSDFDPATMTPADVPVAPVEDAPAQTEKPRRGRSRG